MTRAGDNHLSHHRPEQPFDEAFHVPPPPRPLRPFGHGELDQQGRGVPPPIGRPVRGDPYRRLRREPLVRPDVVGHRVEIGLELASPFPRILAERPPPAEHHLLRAVVELDFDAHGVKVAGDRNGG